MTTTRDQIIQATCELLELQGFHGTGLSQIIKESGSPKGSLYYHFPGGKEELTAESLDYVGRIVLGRIRNNLAAIDDPGEAISAFIMNIAHNVEASGYRMGGPITTVAMETAASSERLRTVCDRIYGEWQTAVADKLRDSGFDDARAKRLALLVIAGIEGGIILCRTGKTRTPLEHVAEELRVLIGQ